MRARDFCPERAGTRPFRTAQAAAHTQGVNGGVVFVVAVTVWVVAGLVSSLLMARRGHNLFTWWYLSLVLGPLVVPLELSAVARARRSAQDGRPVGPGRVAGKGAGPAVLAGLDGSEESLAALDHALRLLAPRVRWLTVATVTDYETAAGEPLAGGDPSTAVLDAGVRVARTRVPETSIDTVRLRGRPDAALLRFAAEGGFDLLVVGPTGRGAVTRLLGSTARGVLGASDVPVLVGPRRGTAAVVSPADLAVLGVPVNASALALGAAGYQGAAGYHAVSADGTDVGG